MKYRLLHTFTAMGVGAIFMTAAPAFGQDIDVSQPAKAESELIQLVDDWRQEREVHPSLDSNVALGEALQALGVIRRQLGHTDLALENLEEACQLLEAAPKSSLADAQEALAITLQDSGHFEKAEALLRKVVEHRREAGLDLPLAHALDHLAMNQLVAAEYTEVAKLLEEALDLIPPGEPISRAQTLGHLSRYYHTLGSHSRSMATIDEALALPFEDPELRLSLRSQYALGQLRLGEIDEAVKAFQEIASDAQSLFSERPLSAVPYINNLGALSLNLGQFEEALESFTTAVQMLEETVGSGQPGLMTPLNNLGVALLKSGRAEEAKKVLDRCLKLQEEYLDPVHLRVAEARRNRAFAALTLGDDDALELVDRTTKVSLQLLDEVIQNGSEKERLNFLSRFDMMSLPCATGDSERIANTLIACKGRLLDTLLGDKEVAIPSMDDLSSALPVGSAFIDVCRYFPNDEQAGARYGAILYLPNAAPRWIELASEEAAVRWLDALRERLRWQGGKLSGEKVSPPTLKASTILSAIYRDFWEPIARWLPDDTQHIAWSPDGALHFIPLAATLDPSKTPLCHLYHQITTVAHAREMVAPSPEGNLLSSPWSVVTVSDFPKPPPASDTSPPLIRILTSLEDMPGTKTESRYLSKLAPPGSMFLHDKDAREVALSTMKESPSVLHLGCHAFFIADTTGDAGLPIDFDDHSDLLFAGGLVLYQGAIRPFSGPPVLPDDDVLFPSEIAELPLANTRLVTLSSCDSGNGTPVSGEGLLGLRRSFHLAGASEVAVALWPVSDASTPRFMRNFYRRAIMSDRPAQALWETQRDLIPQGDDPDFEAAVLRYAPFIISQSGPLQTGPQISLPPDSGKIWIVIGSIITAILAVLMALVSRRRSIRS